MKSKGSKFKGVQAASELSGLSRTEAAVRLDTEVGIPVFRRDEMDDERIMKWGKSLPERPPAEGFDEDKKRGYKWRAKTDSQVPPTSTAPAPSLSPLRFQTANEGYQEALSSPDPIVLVQDASGLQKTYAFYEHLYAWDDSITTDKGFMALKGKVQKRAAASQIWLSGRNTALGLTPLETDQLYTHLHNVFFAEALPLLAWMHQATRLDRYQVIIEIRKRFCASIGQEWSTTEEIITQPVLQGSIPTTAAKELYINPPETVEIEDDGVGWVAVVEEVRKKRTVYSVPLAERAQTELTKITKQSQGPTSVRSARRVAINDTSKTAPGVSYAARAGFDVTPKHSPDHEFSQWELIHISAARHHADRGRVNIDRTGHGPVIRFSSAIHWPPPRGTSRNVAYRITLGKAYVQEEGKSKYVLIVTHAYHLLCLSTGGRKMHPKARAYLLAHANAYVVNLRNDAGPPSDARLLDFMPPGRMIATQLGVFTTPLQMFMRLHEFFMNAEDKKWVQLLTALLTDHVGLTTEEYAVVLRVLKEGIERNWRSRGRSVFAFISPTNRWSFNSDGYLQPNGVVLYARNSGFSWALSPLDLVLYGPIVSPLVQTFRLQGGTIRDSEVPLDDSTQILLALEESGFSANFPFMIKIISFLVIGSEIRTFASWAALVTLSVPEVPERMAHCIPMIVRAVAKFKRACRNTESEWFTLQADSSTPQTPESAFAALRRVLFGPHCLGFLSTELGSALWEIVSAFSVVGVFASSGIMGSPHLVKSYIRDLNQLLKVSAVPGVSSVESFVERCVRFITIFAERLHTAIAQRDWTELFKDDLTVSKWVSWADTLMKDETVRFDPGRPAMGSVFKTSRALGLLPPQFVKTLDVDERIAMAREVITAAEPLLSRYANDKFVLLAIKHKISELRNEERALIATGANSSYRLVPWGLFIHGAPGVGKTTLCAKLHAVIGEHLGFKGDETTMYRLDPGSNFHDTFHNDQWGALLDDIDQSLARPTAGVMNHAEIVNKFINSAPFSMERADVHEKGKFFANFLAVYYATNFADGKLKDVSECPIQFHRRFPVRVDMRVKEEYADAAGGLHKERAFLNGVLRANAWDFHVRVYDPAHTSTDKFELPYGPVRVFTDECSFLAAMSNSFKQHYEREVAHNARRRTHTPVEGAMCPHCLQPVEKHVTRAPCSIETLKLQGLTVTDVDMIIKTGALAFTAWYIGSRITELVGKAIEWTQHLPPNYQEVAELWVLRKVVDQIGYPLLAWHYGPAWVSKTVARITSGDCATTLVTFAKDNYKAIAVALAGLLAGLPLLRKFFTREREKLMHQGLAPSLPTGLPRRRDPWFTLNPTLFEREYSSTKKKTYTLSEFGAVVSKRIFRVKGEFGGLVGVALGGGAFMVNKHALFSQQSREVHAIRDITTCPDGAWLAIQVGNAWVHVVLDKTKTTLLEGRDVLITWLPEAVVLKTKWDLVDELPPTCLARQGNRPDEAFLVTAAGLVAVPQRMQGVPGYAKPTLDRNYSWEHELPLSDGDCGTPLIARFGDRFFLVGIHGVSRVREQYGAVLRSSRSESLALDELQEAVARARDKHGSSLNVVFDPEMIEPGSDGFTLQGLPVRSSLRVALSSKDLPFYTLGTYAGPKKMGSTMATRITPTGFSDPVLTALRSEVLQDDSFAAPVFTGSMGIASFYDGTGFRWEDPHTRAMESCRNVGGDPRFWSLAKADFLTHIEKLSGSTGIVPLSDWAAVKGVPGTMCGGFDLGTSAGPPFFGPKKICVRVDETTDPPTVVIDPDLKKGMERILAVVIAGDVYSPPAIHCLKDETVTVKKNRAHKIRVFNIMPFAFNLLLKKYISPIACFYREHPLFFEHAIGLNITSEKDASMMRSFLSTFPNVLASDVSNFDTTASTRELYVASEVVLELATLIGYSEHERKILWGLLMSAMHVTHVNKGDFWLTNHGLASGYWITLFLNCIRNSLQARYAYYALAPGPVPLFREVVKMLVLGDDNFAGVRGGFEWYNQVSVAESLLAVGATRTSSIKDRALTPYEAFDEATFLKRTFTELEGMCVCPIEKKTLYRMLTFRRKTSLSTHDHLCVILSTVVGESWMWGEEYFDIIVGLCRRLAQAHALGGRNLRIDTFAEYVSRYRTGEFCAWSPLTDQEPFQI